MTMKTLQQIHLCVLFLSIFVPLAAPQTDADIRPIYDCRGPDELFDWEPAIRSDCEGDNVQCKPLPEETCAEREEDGKFVYFCPKLPDCCKPWPPTSEQQKQGCPTDTPTTETTPTTDETTPTTDETTETTSTSTTTSSTTTSTTTETTTTSATTTTPTTTAPKDPQSPGTESVTTPSTDEATGMTTTNTTDDGNEATTPYVVAPPGYTPPTPTTGTDHHSWCCLWALKGQCDQNADFMRVVCQNSCGTVGCKAETAKDCKVQVAVNETECRELSKDGGPLSPGTSVSADTPEPRRVQFVSELMGEKKEERLKKGYCANQSPNCKQWAEAGECDKNPFWMKVNCQRSCVCCDCTYASVAGLTYTHDCRDYHKLCPYWASVNHCDSNPNYMKVMCQAACKQC